MDFNLTYGSSLSIQWQTPDAIATIFGTFQDKIEALLPGIVAVTADQLETAWATEAKNSLKNPDGYVKAISQRQITDTHIIVSNNHVAVWFLELGTAPFDQKRMLDTGRSVRISKDGNRYIRIPFDGKVKDYIAAGVDEKELSRMQGTKFVNVRGARLITEYGSRLNTQAQAGTRKHFTVLKATRDKFPNKTNAPNMGFTDYVTPFKAATTIDYAWKTSPFQNAVKMTDFQGKTVGMKTFRTISDLSDPNSWINPGVQASHIAEKAILSVRPMFDAAIAQSIAPIMDDFHNSMESAGFTE